MRGGERTRDTHGAVSGASAQSSGVQVSRGFEERRVLVTGGAGFIGSHLVDALVAEGARVVVVDNLQAGGWANLDEKARQATRETGDVRDASALQRIVNQYQPEFVFHLAANASVPGSVADPAYDFQTNCGGTFALLDVLRRLSPCPTVVLASSGAVYGEPRHLPITETDPLCPISPYGASKLAAEVESRMFVEVYGLPVVLARIFNSYGPRMPRFVVLDFLRKLRDTPGCLEILGSGKQVRDFTYVGDTVAGLLLLALRGAAGEAYNIASGVPHSVTDLALALLRILGLEGKTEIRYSGASWVGDAQRWEVDVSKLRDLGYRPRTDLETGLKQVVGWFRAK